MNTDEMNQQVIDLQSRISHQEDSIQVMSLQLAKQADELKVAQKHIELLNNKLNDVMNVLESQQMPDGERPPHY